MNRLPLRNRVTATGEIVAHPARGMFMGNRGVLHDDKRELGHAVWKHKAWITCTLVWKDWKRVPMTPGAYTELFFLDEAVALAAGHRPCALCRRPSYNAYLAAIEHAGMASDLDRRLHRERAIPRRFEQRRHKSAIATLPDGAMILTDAPYLVSGNTLRPVTPEGYGAPRERPVDGYVSVLTPETSIIALKRGYRPKLHVSAL